MLTSVAAGVAVQGADLGGALRVGGEQLVGLLGHVQRLTGEAEVVLPRLPDRLGEDGGRDRRQLVVDVGVPDGVGQDEVRLQGGDLLEGRLGDRADVLDRARVDPGVLDVGRQLVADPGAHRPDRRDTEREDGVELTGVEDDDPLGRAGELGRPRRVHDAARLLRRGRLGRPGLVGPAAGQHQAARHRQRSPRRPHSCLLPEPASPGTEEELRTALPTPGWPGRRARRRRPGSPGRSSAGTRRRPGRRPRPAPTTAASPRRSPRGPRRPTARARPAR